MTFFSDLSWSFQEKYEGYCMLATSITIILTSPMAAFIYVRRSRRYGMLLTTLVTFIVYAGINIVEFALGTVYSNSVTASLINVKGVFWMSTAKHLSELIVSLAGIFLALDRCMVMSMALNYNYHKIGFKLALCCGVLNAALIIMQTVLVVLLEVCAFFENILVMFNLVMMQIALPMALTVESLLHVLFCVKLWRYLRCRTNTIAKRQTAQTNHITICQVICHTLLCAIPNLAVFVTQLHKSLHVEWVDNLYMFYRVAFATSVMLASTFTLYRLRPVVNFTKIATTSSAFSPLRPTS